MRTGILGKILASLAGRGIGALSQLVMVVVLGRMYQLNGFSSFMLTWSWMVVAAAVGRVGMDGALMRCLGRCFPDGGFLRHQAILRNATIVVMFGSLMSGLMALGLAYIGFLSSIREPDFWTIGALVLLSTVPFSLTFVNSEALKAMDKAGMANFFQSGANPIAFMVFAAAFWTWGWSGRDALGLSWLVATTLVSLLTAALAWHRLFSATVDEATSGGSLPPRQQAYSGEKVAGRNGWVVDREPPADFRGMLTIGLPMMVFSTLSMVCGWLPLWVLGAVETGNLDSVGQFAAATRFALMISFVLTAFNSVTPPKFARMYSEHRFAEMEQLGRKTAAMMAAIATPIALFLMIFAEPVMSLPGPEFRAASTALAIMAFGQIINASTGSVAWLMMMTGLEKHLRTTSILNFLLCLVLSLTLIPAYGLTGAALTAMAVNCFGNTFNVWITWRKLGIGVVPFMPRGRSRMRQPA